MSIKEKLKSFTDKIENKALRLVAFWSSIAALLALIPSIIAGLYWLYLFGCDLYNLSTYVKEFKKSAQYSNFMDMQSQSIDHEEMDSDTIFGVILQKTNSGDLYYFDTIRINNNIRPIVYGANVKNKANQDGYHVNITDMDGVVRWIKPKL